MNFDVESLLKKLSDARDGTVQFSVKEAIKDAEWGITQMVWEMNALSIEVESLKSINKSFERIIESYISKVNSEEPVVKRDTYWAVDYARLVVDELNTDDNTPTGKTKSIYEWEREFGRMY